MLQAFSDQNFSRIGGHVQNADGRPFLPNQPYQIHPAYVWHDHVHERQIDWLTPGMAGMMVMWANLAVGATLIAWRERGILKRLAVTPLRRHPHRAGRAD